MARVFSAVDLEDGELLEGLVDARDMLDLGFSPVEREKMHVTLQFFRDIEGDELDEVREALLSIEQEPFTAEVRGIGVFPSEDYIRVVWAGFAEEKPFRRLKEAVSRHGVEEDSENSFKPHVTLLRVENLSREEKKKLQRSLREFHDHRFGELKVDSVKLFRSDLGPEGPEYTVLEEKEL